jgi:hypothetical protein
MSAATNNRSQIVAAFNAHFLEFIRSVEAVFPDNSDISTARKTVGKLIAIMPGTLIKVFKEKFVSVYKTQLEAGDIGFFINKDYAQDLNGIVGEQSNSVLQKIDCLREPIRSMTPTEQGIVIKYLQNLMKLSESI